MQTTNPKGRMSKLEQILKPDANWEVKKIDFDSPKVKESLEYVRKAHQEAMERKHWNQEQFDRLRLVINI